MAEPELSAERQKQLIETGKMIHALAADKATRPDVLKLLKKADPNQVIPELEIEEQAEAKASAHTKPLIEKNAALEKKLDDLSRHVARTEWQRAVGLDDEEVVEVEKFAKENDITSAAKAVKFWRQEQALGTPRGTRKPDGADEYLSKIRKVDPRSATGSQRLKQLAIEEGTRLLQTAARNRRSA